MQYGSIRFTHQGIARSPVLAATIRIASVTCVLWSILAATPSAEADLQPDPDGQTIVDTTVGVTWLADANLAGSLSTSSALRDSLGVQNIDPSLPNYININPDGSMSYDTAQQWVKALNAHQYLGHDNWTLPFSPKHDDNCLSIGKDHNSFGFGCRDSALASLFYESLNLTDPNTAVSTLGSTPANTYVDLFKQFQPYLYWSSTAAPKNPNGGHKTFSFNTGFDGANTDENYLYVLPMLQHAPKGVTLSPCPGAPALQCSPQPGMVYDPNAGRTGVTWLADADLAATLVAACGKNSSRVECSLIQDLDINSDGSMDHRTAEKFVDAMKTFAWLDQADWELPADSCPTGFGCVGSPMADLYSKILRLTAGTPVVSVPDGNASVGPFKNVQPYLYWSCNSDTAPINLTCDGSPDYLGVYQWSFSFGNGFQGTDVRQNDLYVMVYAYSPPTPEHRGGEG
jgi:hypothetical protein